MHILYRLLLRLISGIVPLAARLRWLEEWRAELAHGGWRMLAGAVPDAMTLRALGRHEARHPRPALFHALGQDVRYALRILANGKSFTLAVIGSLAIGIAATTTGFAVVNAALFRPYPGVHAQEDLVRITAGPPASLGHWGGNNQAVAPGSRIRVLQEEAGR